MALTDLNGRIVRLNQALCRLTGRTAAETIGQGIADLADPQDVEADALQRLALIEGRLQVAQTEQRYRRAAGASTWVQVSVSLARDGAGRPAHFVVHVQDIAGRKALETRLEQLADRDPLTELLNGRGFARALDEEGRRAARYGGGAVLLVDLDHFKSVNDTFGHQAGNDLLRATASALTQRLRDTDTLARLGGDEFAIILPRVDAVQAERVAACVVRTVRRQPAMQGTNRVSVTASVGVALFDTLDGDAILAAADLAMYDAKARGRDQFVRYGHHAPPVGIGPSRLHDVERIQRAVARRELELHCQPILALATNDVSQYELLPCLRTAEGDLLHPGAFLEVAERFGAAPELDTWVVHQAAKLVAREADAGRTVTLHVNIAASSINHPTVLAGITEALSATGIHPGRLVFELGEAATLGNPDGARTFTAGLRRQGCRVALDDFGSGFDAFCTVQDLPFDYFKFDGRSFRGFGADPVDGFVVEAVVGIAKKMGRQTVATLVSDGAMSNRLRDSGVDFVQGFHAGLPRPAVDVFGYA